MNALSLLKRLFQALSVSLLLAGMAQAADQGSAAEAEAMVKKEYLHAILFPFDIENTAM